MDDNTAREVVIARLHPHAGRLVLPSLAAIIVCCGFGLSLAYLSDSAMVWGAFLLCVGLIVVVWVLPVLTWRSSQFTLTTHRVIVSEGLFRRSRTEIPIARIHDVTVRATAFQAVFASGDVHLGTGAQRDVVMRHVPRVRLVAAAVTKLVESSAAGEARQRRESARWT